MSPPKTNILCVNAGSSSLKYSLFAFDGVSPRRVAGGDVNRIGTTGSTAPDYSAAIETAFSSFSTNANGSEGGESPSAVGHRIVHGGPRLSAPCVIDEAVLAELVELVPLSPLHLPPAIEAIRATRARLPGVPQVACFDTAFHGSIPEVARRLPLPDRFDHEGIRRYGFHGLSYEYVMSVLGTEAPSRIVIAHLGNGASLVAVKDGRAIDTTMSFTPTGGIPMGTRSGDLDPGVLLYLLRERGYTERTLTELVEHDAGLVAIGGASDVRTLMSRMTVDAHARLALDVFAYSIKKTIGAYVAALGGIDLLVFTGGIGEHAAPIRAEACRGLEGLGIELDQTKNAAGDPRPSSVHSRCVVRVVRTDEELVIARHTRDVLLSLRRPS